MVPAAVRQQSAGKHERTMTLAQQGHGSPTEQQEGEAGLDQPAASLCGETVVHLNHQYHGTSHYHTK